jgi:hypothetical protein
VETRCAHTSQQQRQGKIIIVIISAALLCFCFFSGNWKTTTRKTPSRQKQFFSTMCIAIDAPPDTLQMTVAWRVLLLFSRFENCRMSRRDLFIIKEKYLI